MRKYYLLTILQLLLFSPELGSKQDLCHHGLLPKWSEIYTCDPWTSWGLGVLTSGQVEKPCNLQSALYTPDPQSRIQPMADHSPAVFTRENIPKKVDLSDSNLCCSNVKILVEVEGIGIASFSFISIPFFIYFIYSLFLFFIACVLSRISCVWLFASPWTVAHQAPLSMVFSRQEYWSGLPYPPPGDLPNLGIKPASLMSPALTGGFFTTSATWVLANIMYSPIFSHFLCLLMNS